MLVIAPRAMEKELDLIVGRIVGTAANESSTPLRSEQHGGAPT